VGSFSAAAFAGPLDLNVRTLRGFEVGASGEVA